ncbi:hypothetical protein BGX33_002899 [Mortierella sp. NVP41]|nr:hypothetical protein BGX33_002899 [Mortierella sp. NVP41]
MAPSQSGSGLMDLDAITIMKISHDERQRRMDNKLYLYCGDSDHRVSKCPVKKPIQANIVFEESENDEAEI